MSIEKYLNEINEEIAMENENVEGVATLVGMLLAAIGLWGYTSYKDYKEKKERSKKMQANEKDRKEKVAKIKEEILKKYNTTDIKIATEKAVKIIVSDIEKMVNKMNKDPKVKELIKKSVDKFKKEYPEDDARYTLSCDPHEMGKDKNGIYGGYVQIIHADQDLILKLSWIIHDIIDALEIKYEDECSVLVDFGSGDGDEGCLYINH